MNNNDSNIFHLIMDLSWFFGSQSFNGNCCGDLSLIEYMTLKKISILNNPSVQFLGKELNITKSGISKVLTKLEKKGYIEKGKNQDDARVCCLLITTKGSDILKEINKSYTQYISSALSSIDDTNIKDIIKSLETLYIAFNKKGYKKKEV